MAFQLIPWLATTAGGSAIGSSVGAVVGTYWSTYFAPGFEPDKVIERYDAFLRKPRVRPIPDALFDAWVHARISDEDAVWTLLLHGVPCEPIGQREEVIERIAAQVGESSGLGRDVVRQLVTSGLNRDRGLSDLWKDMREAHRTVPSASDWQAMRARGMATDAEWSTGLLRAGASRDDYLNTLELYQTHPPIEVLMAARTRGFIDQDRFFRKLELHGISAPADREMIDKLRNYLPPVSDIIRFAVREALTPTVAEDLGLYSEVPSEARSMAAQQGLDWPLDFPIRVDGILRMATPFDLYWAAHWLTLSPGQIYDASHRLRPDRVGYYSEQLTELLGRPITIEPFTHEDADRYLRIADYPPSTRDWLLALSFNPLRLVDIHAAGRFLLRDRNWLIGQFLDRGSTPADAAFQVDLIEARRDYEARAPQRSFLNSLNRAAAKDIVDGYAVGMLGREQAVPALSALGFTPAEVDTILSRTDQRARLDSWKAFIRTIRREYLGGIISDEEALGYLANAGMTGERRRQRLDLWRPLRYQRAARFTMPQILQHVAAGRMSPLDASTRLARLGFSAPDQLILSAQIQGIQRDLQARLARAAEGAAKKRARELVQASQRIRSAQRQIAADLRRIAPLSTLKRWLTLGIRTQKYVRNMLFAQGYPPLEIASYMTEWVLEAKKTRETAVGAQSEEERLQGAAAATPGPDGTGSTGQQPPR